MPKSSRLKVEKLGLVLEPTKNSFEKTAVLNPACYQDGEFVHVFYRAIDGLNRSSIGYAKLHGPNKVVERWNHPIIGRDYPYEKKGVEDPRITKIGNIFYVTYVVHDGRDALIAYATSRDLKNFKKRGIISPRITYDRAADFFRRDKLKDRYFMFEAFYEEFANKKVLLWEKDGFLFPKKIKGKFAMVHRVLPDIHVIYFRNFSQLKSGKFWKHYLRQLSQYVILENKYWFESRNIGGGAPPVETKDGWILIFHAVEELNKERVYRAGAALLDRKNPQKVIGRLDYPLFEPEKKWEKTGFVNNVVFPTGTAVFGDDLYIYYGAADRAIAVAKVSIKKLIQELKLKGKKKS
ncbi:pesticidal protein Cry7Aa [Candidatus Wolfebacteria bacterium]|nr:pesticidal protein Cry7Aa [Candidatus Wolfebacteria bacterium]